MSIETEYRELESFYADDEEINNAPPGIGCSDVKVKRRSRRWHHIQNLDEFFTRVYRYHQGHGFLTMCLSDVLELAQFVFVVLFATFLLQFVNYDVSLWSSELVICTDKLFDDIREKKSLADVILPFDQWKLFPTWLTLCLVLSVFVFLLRFIRTIYNMIRYMEIRSFYQDVLDVPSSEVSNLSWNEVQAKLLTAQKEVGMCINSADVTELTIYHRILRFKNYQVAMVNKDIFPIRFKRFNGYVYYPLGLKYNLEFIFFWGPFSPFRDSYNLRTSYRDSGNRETLAHELSRSILWIGLLNLLLSPVILLWQLLYSFFSYTELIKRNPSTLGTRRWSHYGRLYLRHLNELDHELDLRLNQAYNPARQYMDLFQSNAITVVAQHLAFVAGSIFAAIVVLTLVDDDTLALDNIISTMTLLGLIVTACRVFIPEDNQIWCPNSLMTTILNYIHYCPDSWDGRAHTAQVRAQFSHLFQFKATFVLEELLSPILTPFILLFWARRDTLRYVEFFDNFTTSLNGVGDVCAFAAMDPQKYGEGSWLSEDGAPSRNQTMGGKTELSLVRFTITNPSWRPPDRSADYLAVIKKQLKHDLKGGRENVALLKSQLSSLPMPPMVSSSLGNLHYRGRGVSRAVGAIGANVGGLLPSLLSSSIVWESAREINLASGSEEAPLGGDTNPSHLMTTSDISHELPATASWLHARDSAIVRGNNSNPGPGLMGNDPAVDYATVNAAFSTSYLRELHHRKRRLDYTQAVGPVNTLGPNTTARESPRGIWFQSNLLSLVPTAAIDEDFEEAVNMPLLSKGECHEQSSV